MDSILIFIIFFFAATVEIIIAIRGVGICGVGWIVTLTLLQLQLFFFKYRKGGGWTVFSLRRLNPTFLCLSCLLYSLDLLLEDLGEEFSELIIFSELFSETFVQQPFAVLHLCHKEFLTRQPVFQLFYLEGGSSKFVNLLEVRFVWIELALFNIALRS